MKVADVVISICGHDIGEWYLVYKVSGKFLYLIDGKNKTLEKPKKKKIKHVLQTNNFADSIALKLSNKQNIQNAEIRKAIKFFKEQNIEENVCQRKM